jgi:hypothetical protein
MPSKYLFLSDAQRTLGGTSGSNWLNLPTLSSSTRECYLRVTSCQIELNGAEATIKNLTLKMNIPSVNYFSSDNREVVVARLSLTQPTVYELQLENTIQILTNDNLKNLDFVLENNSGTNFSLGASDFMNIMLELTYVDQKEQVMSQLSTVPQHL